MPSLTTFVMLPQGNSRPFLLIIKFPQPKRLHNSMIHCFSQFVTIFASHIYFFRGLIPQLMFSDSSTWQGCWRRSKRTATPLPPGWWSWCLFRCGYTLLSSSLSPCTLTGKMSTDLEDLGLILPRSWFTW